MGKDDILVCPNLKYTKTKILVGMGAHLKKKKKIFLLFFIGAFIRTSQEVQCLWCAELFVLLNLISQPVEEEEEEKVVYCISFSGDWW